MLPATVHAALLVLFSWLVRLLWVAVFNVDLEQSIYDAIAAQIVAYILSLAGLALFNRGRGKGFAASSDEYVPPFTG